MNEHNLQYNVSSINSPSSTFLDTSASSGRRKVFLYREETWTLHGDPRMRGITSFHWSMEPHHDNFSANNVVAGFYRPIKIVSFRACAVVSIVSRLSFGMYIEAAAPQLPAEGKADGRAIQL